MIRARNLIVRLRTATVNAVRGLAKPCGYRLPASSTLCFANRCMAVLPSGLVEALGPVLEQIAAMTVEIKQYDRTIRHLRETQYPETQALLQVYGVGQLKAYPFDVISIRQNKTPNAVRNAPVRPYRGRLSHDESDSVVDVDRLGACGFRAFVRFRRGGHALSNDEGHGGDGGNSELPRPQCQLDSSEGKHLAWDQMRG